MRSLQILSKITGKDAEEIRSKIENGFLANVLEKLNSAEKSRIIELIACYCVIVSYDENGQNLEKLNKAFTAFHDVSKSIEQEMQVYLETGNKLNLALKSHFSFGTKSAHLQDKSSAMSLLGALIEGFFND